MRQTVTIVSSRIESTSNTDCNFRAADKPMLQRRFRVTCSGRYRFQLRRGQREPSSWLWDGRISYSRCSGTSGAPRGTACDGSGTTQPRNKTSFTFDSNVHSLHIPILSFHIITIIIFVYTSVTLYIYGISCIRAIRVGLICIHV